VSDIFRFFLEKQTVQEFKKVVNAIRAARSILVTSHIRGDGDSFGAALAAAHALGKAGKAVTTSIDSQVPDIYLFLPGVKGIVPPSKVRQRFDLVLALDTPTLDRLGGVKSLLGGGARVVNIDHHRTNVRFGNVNWVDVKASSVGEMIFRLIRALRLRIDDAVAQNLYTAIVTDTGRFTYENTTPASLRIVAELIEAGVEFTEIARNVYQSTTPEVFALRALAMKGMRFVAGGRVGVMRVTRTMFKKSGARPINTQDFVDVPRSIKGVSVAVLLTDMEKPGWVKVSLRSDRSLEVDKVAALFGGGGHARAAGCEIRGTIQQVSNQVLAEITARLDKRMPSP
jgi:phosphoesterase RecJ-like protein